MKNFHLKILVFLICISFFSRGYASEDDVKVKAPVLPDHVSRFLIKHNLKMPTSISKYCGFEKNSNPFFISGDFDGDKKLDYAVNATDKQNRLTVVYVFLSKGEIHKLSGLDFIYTEKSRGKFGTMEAVINLKYDSIGVVRCESSSLLYVYDIKKQQFAEYWTSD
jgi:hypothetical protein